MRVVLVVLASFHISAHCGGSDDVHAEKRRFGPFEYVHPRPYAQFVSSATSIAFRQGEKLNFDSLKDKVSVEILGKGGHLTRGEVRLALDGCTVVYTPTELLPFGAKVLVSVKEGGNDKQRTFMLPKFSWTFTIMRIYGRSNKRSDVAKRHMAYKKLNREAVPQKEVSVLPDSFFLDDIHGHTDDPMDFPSPKVGENRTVHGMPDPSSFLDRSNAMHTLPLPRYRVEHYKTLPWHFPKIRIATRAKQNKTSDGYIFISNKKSHILLHGKRYFPFLFVLDNQGDVVFYLELPPSYTGDGRCRFRVADNGNVQFGTVQLGKTYQTVAKVMPPHGYDMDGHDLAINKNGNVMMLHRDLQSVKVGKKWIRLAVAIVTEQDRMGNVVFEWRMWDHLTPQEIVDLSIKSPWERDDSDLVHPNAIYWTPSGDHVYSFRHFGIAVVNRRTGDIIKKIGGKWGEYDYPANETRPFQMQHDTQILEDGTLIMMDNNNYAAPYNGRMVEYSLDDEKMKILKTWEFTNERYGKKIYTVGNGSVQRLYNNNRGICWGGLGLNNRMQSGSNPVWTEVTPKGEKVLELFLEDGSNSQQAYKMPLESLSDAIPYWPVTALLHQPTMKLLNIHFSWNGATVVKSWRVLSGNKELARISKTKFEDYLDVSDGLVKCISLTVVALDKKSVELRRSRTLRSPACP
eukprot:TRINITY_DN69627_c1_g1_i1.p1 TRINITY_DN69627_c1_g1~~TRINITY_DN69627_c1_g1_i1.p1  ORF type:complete len:685 (-),score=80.27 TRINITY_DN69627_c1_g1_i1:223-2277(-)